MPARRSLQRNAEDLGFEVEAVCDGASGLKRACAKHFNLELVAEYLPDASALYKADVSSRSRAACPTRTNKPFAAVPRGQACVIVVIGGGKAACSCNPW
jgi:hypothetical protein